MSIIKIFERALVAHRYDEWAEEQTLVAAKVMQQAAADILKQINEKVEEASLADGFSTSAFIRKHVMPITQKAGEELAKDAVEDANRSLAEIVDLKLLWSRRLAHEPEDPALEGVGDVLSAAVPLGLAAASAAALPTAAITTTTTFLGLSAITTISWPVVLIGGGLVIAGAAIGGVEATKLKDKARERVRTQAREYVLAALVKGTPSRPAILEQLETEFRETARKAKEL